jgi:hypothetical protein
MFTLQSLIQIIVCQGTTFGLSVSQGYTSCSPSSSKEKKTRTLSLALEQGMVRKGEKRMGGQGPGPCQKRGLPAETH